ncbi:MAG: DegT/DnrJ/EryC1/StrS family aminotransferase [Dehalococcoidia bacterium]
MQAVDTLAILGGAPVRDQFLLFASPLLSAEDEQEVVECLRSGWVTYGPRSQRFEAAFADFVGARHAIGVNSCTAALHLALIVAGIEPGDEVITTPITFPATANVILHVGGTPVFVDVEPDTFNIDPAAVRRAVTPRTRAIMPVHMSGHACDMDAIRTVAEEYGLTVIEDAAHAIETRYHGRNVGSLSPFTAFSFYATKNLWTVAGGMITTDDDEAAERLRRLRTHGITSAAWSRYGASGYVPYETLEPGFNYGITDLQAALGLNQLDRILERWETRRRLVEAYDRAFAGNPYLTLPRRATEPTERDAYHLYQVLLRTDRLGVTRNEFASALQSENVGIGVHFTAVHRHPFYRDLLEMEVGALPVAEDIGERIISLPLFTKMTDGDVADVVRAVEKLTAHYARN